MNISSSIGLKKISSSFMLILLYPTKIGNTCDQEAKINKCSTFTSWNFTIREDLENILLSKQENRQFISYSRLAKNRYLFFLSLFRISGYHFIFQIRYQINRNSSKNTCIVLLDLNSIEVMLSVILVL